MASGGARARSGPAPDPSALRRDRASDAAGWVTLPNEGRKGDPPSWPLPTEVKRERELWAQLWSLPQAVQWEASRQELQVALYVRRLAEAEQPDAATNLGTLVRQMGDGLGLTLDGMLKHRWRIAADEVAQRSESKPVKRSSRDRFKVVKPDGDGA